MGCIVPEGGLFDRYVGITKSLIYTQIQAAQFEASESLSFLYSWKPVLTNPYMQVSQESITGYKERYDLGYSLRVRYPSLYNNGTLFLAWYVSHVLLECALIVMQRSEGKSIPSCSPDSAYVRQRLSRAQLRLIRHRHHCQFIRLP